MIVAFLAAMAAFLLFLGLTVVRSMHMLQLNSYKASTHLRWLHNNTGSLLPGFLGAGATAVLLALPVQPVVSLSVMAVLFALLSLTQRLRKAKKPLVYTKRVIRMLCTIGLILVLVYLVCLYFASAAAFMLAAAILSALAPLLVLAANFLNKPLEKAINRHYINDAKRLLKSCPDLLTIGVTGSYGKTSVKYILHTLLQSEFETLKTPESYNTPMGVVKTVRSSLRATHQVFVCEMGARRVGDIQELCDIVNPGMGIITSVGPQHLETFLSIDNVKKTKFELADALPSDGTVFLNMEDENIRSYANHAKCQVISYGLSDRCDYYATDISASTKGTTFTLHTPQGTSESFTTKLVGAHNVINIVGAMAICCQLGIPLTLLKSQVRKLQAVPHRLQLIRRGGITIIDDAFNSNPTGARAAIDALSLFDGCKILVTPGMVELGAKQDELNQAFGAYAAKVCDYVMLVGRKQTQSIYEGLRSAEYPETNIYVADTLQDALSKAYSINAEEKIILLENDLPDNF